MDNILRYIGSMQNIFIKDSLPKNTEIYVEPFGGSFSCGFNLLDNGFLKKTVLNDKDENIYAFWKSVQENPEKLIADIKYIVSEISDQINPYDEINKFASSNDKFILGAYEWLTCNKSSIDGKSNDDRLLNPSIDEELFIEHSIRLANTDITNLDYLEVLEKYDSENTFFMMDPPYNVHGANRYYRNTDKFYHRGLREILHSLKGNWVVRYSDDDYTKELYKDCNIFFTTQKVVYKRTLTEIYYTNLDYRHMHIVD